MKSSLYPSSSTYGGSGPATRRTLSTNPSARQSSGIGSYGTTASTYGASSNRAGSRPAPVGRGYQAGGSSIISEYHHSSGSSSGGGYLPKAPGSSGTAASASNRFSSQGVPFDRYTSGSSNLPSTTSSSMRNRQQSPSGYDEGFGGGGMGERSHTSTAEQYGSSIHSSGSFTNNTPGISRQQTEQPMSHTDRLSEVFKSGTDPYHHKTSSTPTGGGILPPTTTGGTPRGGRNSALGGRNPDDVEVFDGSQYSRTNRTSATSGNPLLGSERGRDPLAYGGGRGRAEHTATPPPISGAANGFRSGTTYAPPTTSSSTVSSSPKYPALPVPFGMRNLGNTCYLNATLQCIIHTNGFAYLCSKEEPRKSRSQLVDDLSELVSSSRTSTGPLLTSVKNRTARINPEFAGYGQNDGHEFLRAILLGIHEEINRSRGAKYQEMKDIEGESDRDAAARWDAYHNEHDNSTVYDTFGGQLRCVTLCNPSTGGCGYRSLTFDPILDLSIPMDKAKTSVELTELIRSFSNPEILTGTNRFNCPRCKKPREAKRQTTISRWPRNLVVHLKRFSASGSKNGGKVNFRSNLDGIPEMVSGVREKEMQENPRAAQEQLPPQYKLRGVVIHHGTSSFGHYTAYVYHRGKSSSSSSDAGWYYCDDSRISPVTESEVLREQSGAYLLFYEAVTAVPTRKSKF